MATEREVNAAARRLRASLEAMLENIPPDDPAYMPIARLEATRRWDRSHKGVSARRRADMRKEGGRPQPRKFAGKTATFLSQRFDRVL